MSILINFVVEVISLVFSPQASFLIFCYSFMSESGWRLLISSRVGTASIVYDIMGQ